MSIYDVNGNPLDIGSMFFNVTDYGAKCDGTTDDASAIQSALTACNTSGGGIVFFPEGTYLLKSSVLFYSNQTLWFENGAVLLQGASIDNLLMRFR